MIIDVDAGGIAAKGSAAIRTDDKRRMQCGTIFQFNGCCVSLRQYGTHFAFDNLQR
jgi:hypothetical protein